MSKILNGKELSSKLRNKLYEEISSIKNERKPHLVVILVGDDEASQVYCKSKKNACNKYGLIGTLKKLPSSTSEIELLRLIKELNEDNSVDGILVQLPLPKHINKSKVINAINPNKDVDGFHPINVGKLYTTNDGFVPCTPLGVITLLNEYGINVEGKKALVIGRSNIVGKPMAQLLVNHNATVTVAHRFTENLEELTLMSDIIVSATGIRGLITENMVSKGTVIVDVGIVRHNNKLCGDVDFDNVKNKAGYITPVPGGVGPMTITMLLYNTLRAYKLNMESE